MAWLLPTFLTVYAFVSGVLWLARCAAVWPKRVLSSGLPGRSKQVSQSSMIGMPACWFSNEEIELATVRLLNDIDLGHGYRLWKGECFQVRAIVLLKELRGNVPVTARKLMLTNHRARLIPVRDDSCELIFEWPAEVKGKTNGR